MRHGPGRATRATGLPLGVRFFLLLAGAAVVVTVLLVVVLAGLIWDRLESDVEDNALLLLSTLDWAVAPLLAVDDMASVQRLVESTGSDRSVRNLRVYDRSGTVLASNLLGEIGKPILEPALGDVFEKHTLRSIVEDFDRDEFALAVPVRGQKYVREQWTDINAAIFLRPNIRQQKQRFAPYLATVLLSAVATIVSAIALFTFMLYRWVLRPLSQLALATREVAAGNLSHRVREALPGELGSFATLFNAMLGELHQKEVALQGYTEELEARVTERTRSLSLTNFELAGAYTELKGAQSRLLQSEKMASVGQLAAGVG
ncbi:MAG: HAMP domain-containing protein, partial [Armatimonadetes bacterium]|nr:HAMP domain-containing protein [Armatimonadota bacterium]